MIGNMMNNGTWPRIKTPAEQAGADATERAAREQQRHAGRRHDQQARQRVRRAEEEARRLAPVPVRRRPREGGAHGAGHEARREQRRHQARRDVVLLSVQRVQKRPLLCVFLVGRGFYQLY